MERYLVEFKAKDNKEDYCFILAESPLGAKKWVEEYIHVGVVRVSLIHINDESNKEKEVLWELDENKTELSSINVISQMQEEKPSDTVLLLKNKYIQKLKDLNAMIRVYKKACRIDMEYNNIDDLPSDTKIANRFIAHKNIVKEFVKDLSVAKNEDDIYNVYKKCFDEKNMLDEILVDLKESMHDSNDKSDTKERDE